MIKVILNSFTTQVSKTISIATLAEKFCDNDNNNTDPTKASVNSGGE